MFSFEPSHNNTTREKCLSIPLLILRRFTVGMGFSLMYGALLTKTNRISRIFHSASQSAKRPSYISPRSQLIFTSVFALVQFGATLVWVIAAFPASERVFPRRDEVYQILEACCCTYIQLGWCFYLSIPGDFEMQRQRLQFPGVPGLQHAADLHLHLLRHQDQKGPGELQRGQVHRLHHVHHLHHLASIHPNLLRNRKLV